MFLSISFDRQRFCHRRRSGGDIGEYIGGYIGARNGCIRRRVSCVLRGREGSGEDARKGCRYELMGSGSYIGGYARIVGYFFRFSPLEVV